MKLRNFWLMLLCLCSLASWADEQRKVTLDDSHAQEMIKLAYANIFITKGETDANDRADIRIEIENLDETNVLLVFGHAFPEKELKKLSPKITFDKQFGGTKGKRMIETFKYNNMQVSLVEPSDKFAASAFQVQVGNDVPSGSLIPLYLHKLVAGQDKVDTLYMLVGSSMETFETGDFSAFDWQNTGTNRWIITSSLPYAGAYCARSKQNLGNEQSSEMQITLNAYSDGVVSYYRKVSSESNYDFFYFFIDGEEKEKKSGTVSWGLSSFPVSAGTHTYKFVYEKDFSSASGSDCAWIDNVTLPGAGTKVTEDLPDGVGVEAHEAAQVHVFPNPAANRVTVTAEAPIERIMLYGMDGRLLGTQTGDGDTHQVDVHQLASGIYLLKICLKDGGMVNTKIIKR